jgi:hypothetical protein
MICNICMGEGVGIHSVMCWKVSAIGFVKVNCDAAVDKTKRNLSIGVAVRLSDIAWVRYWPHYQLHFFFHHRFGYSRSLNSSEDCYLLSELGLQRVELEEMLFR